MQLINIIICNKALKKNTAHLIQENIYLYQGHFKVKMTACCEQIAARRVVLNPDLADIREYVPAYSLPVFTYDLENPTVHPEKCTCLKIHMLELYSAFLQKKEELGDCFFGFLFLVFSYAYLFLLRIKKWLLK